MGSQPSAERTHCCHVCETERDEAWQIQHSLLPGVELKGSSFEVAYRFSPVAEVGGDFADFFSLPNGLIGLYVGDVVGKGLPAAMYAALVMGMLRGINKTGEDPASVLALLNKRLLVRTVSGRYAATLYALFNPATLELTFSNAGLLFPLLSFEGGCKQIEHGGIPIGLFPESQYVLHSVQLSPGDAVLFATDGLHELQGLRGDDFGWERLPEIWHACGKQSAADSLELLYRGVKEFSEGGRQHDDITAMVLKVPVRKAEAPSNTLSPGQETGETETCVLHAR